MNSFDKAKNIKEKYYYDYINKDFNCETGECITFKKVHNLVEKYVTLPEVE